MCFNDVIYLKVQMGIPTVPKIRFFLLPWICFLVLQFSFGHASEAVSQVRTVSEELPEMHRVLVDEVDEVSTQSFTIFGWTIWDLVEFVELVVIVYDLRYFCKKILSVICHCKWFGKSPPTSDNVNGVAESEPPFNLDGQNEDETTQPLKSNVRPTEERSENPPERVNNIKASAPLPTSNSVAYSIEEEPGGSENGSEEHNGESCNEQLPLKIVVYL